MEKEISLRKGIGMEESDGKMLREKERNRHQEKARKKGLDRRKGIGIEEKDGKRALIKRKGIGIDEKDGKGDQLEGRE
jgi:hypothetical protein